MTAAPEATPRALVCSSERSLRVLLSDALKSMGFSVLPTEDPSEISRHAKRRRIDLIVLDLLLADVAAIDVARHLREQGMTTPILITTSHADPAFGAQDTLIQPLLKPFGMTELRDTVRVLCPALFPELPPREPES